MRRVLLQYALPLILPLVVYGIWLTFARQRARKAGAAEIPGWHGAPWNWLVAASICLVCVGFIILALQQGAPPDAKYIPPQFINGEIVPGHTE